MPADTHTSVVRVNQLHTLMQGLINSELEMHEQLDDIRNKTAVLEHQALCLDASEMQKKAKAKMVAKVVSLGADFVMPIIDLTLAATTDLSFQDLKELSPALDGAIRDLLVHGSHLIITPAIGSIANHIASTSNVDYTSIDSLRRVEAVLEQNLEIIRKNKIKTVFLYKMLVKQVFGQRPGDAERLASLKESREIHLQKLESLLKLQQKYTSERSRHREARESSDFSHEIQEEILHMIEDQGVLDLEIMLLESTADENKAIRSMQSEALKKITHSLEDAVEENVLIEAEPFQAVASDSFLKNELQKLESMDKNLSEAIARLEVEQEKNAKDHKQSSEELLQKKQNQEQAIERLKMQQKRIKRLVILGTTALAITASVVALPAIGVITPVFAGAVKVVAVGVRQVTRAACDRQTDKVTKGHAIENTSLEKEIVEAEKERSFHKDVEQSKNRIAMMLAVQRFVLEKEMSANQKVFFDEQKRDNTEAKQILKSIQLEKQTLKKNIEKQLGVLQDQSGNKDFSVLNHQKMIIDSAKYAVKNLIISTVLRTTGVDFSEIDEWRHLASDTGQDPSDEKPLTLEEQQQKIADILSCLDNQLVLIEEKIEVCNIKEMFIDSWRAEKKVESKENLSVHKLVTQLFLEDSFDAISKTARSKIRQAIEDVLFSEENRSRILPMSETMEHKLQEEIKKLLQSLLKDAESEYYPLQDLSDDFPKREQIQCLKRQLADFVECSHATSAWRPGFANHCHQHKVSTLAQHAPPDPKKPRSSAS